jgi:formylmethanofuran dehydrogenase subunit D
MFTTFPVTVAKKPVLVFLADQFQLLQTVKVPDKCKTVVFHSGQWYIGCHNSGASVINEGKVSQITQYAGLNVNCIREYKNQFYLLCYSDGFVVRVHSKDGDLVTTWKHEDANTHSKKLDIHEDIIYIPSRSQNKLKSYSLTGGAAGKDISISFSNSNNSPSAVCVTPSSHLVFVQYLPSLVICFEMETRKKLWCLNNLVNPLGITCDKKSGHLLIYTGGLSAELCVQVVDVVSGEL